MPSRPSSHHLAVAAAYVDYVPSRGAVNRSPNIWVPMDASFKQYKFTQGMDIKSIVPFDSQTLLTQIQQGATVDPTNGYVQNPNQTNRQTLNPLVFLLRQIPGF